MDRFWLFTWRTYGTWLPGEEGFVGYYLSPDGRWVIDNAPGEVRSEAIPALERYARGIMVGDPVFLSRLQADAILAQLHETATFRGWILDAVAVVANHVHVVFGVPGDPDPSEMLKSWKSYASRALNRLGVKPNAPRWFADGGSKQPLREDEDRKGAIRYVRDQSGALTVWLSEDASRLIGPCELAT